MSEEIENVEEVEEIQEEEVKTFTQEEVNDIVNSRIARERKDLQKQIDDMKEEQRLDKLSQDEREEAERERREKELAEREQAIAHKERLLETQDELAIRELPTQYASMLATDDAEETLENIKVFEEQYKKDIEKAVKESYAGTTPKVVTQPADTMTQEEFDSLSYPERVELQAKKPELYKQLLNKGD